MKIEMIQPEDLIPYDKNPRVISHDAIEATMMSIKEFKFQQPVVVEPDLTIIVGHTRTLAAIELGMKKIPVIVAHDLTEAQIKQYRISDNKTGQFNAWNVDLLKLEFKELEALDADLTLTAFSEDEIAPLLIDDKPVKKKTSTSSATEESPFSKVQYNLHNDQASVINDAITLARTSPIVDTGLNDSANANALTLICEQWLMDRDKNKAVVAVAIDRDYSKA